MYPDVDFLEGKSVTVGDVRQRTPDATKARLLLRELLPRSRSSIHYVETLGRPPIPYKLPDNHKSIALGDRYRLGVLNL